MPRQTTSSDHDLRSTMEPISRAVQAISQALSIVPVDLRHVLQVIVEQARTVAGAQYAALGIEVAPDRPFEPWVFSGMPEEQAAAIGRFPRPVGMLGAVPHENRTIRVPDLMRDPRFRGWPPHHPDMHSFLGVPIRYRGKSVGNLFLTNKLGAPEFTQEDQWAIELLAAHAAVALQVASVDELRAAVESERARLETILQSAPHAIVFVEAQSGRITTNLAAVQLFGRPLVPSSGTSQYLGQLTRPDGRPLQLAELPSSRALRGQVVPYEELVISRPDGTRVPVLDSAAPVLGPNGQVIGAVAILQDISAMKELERLREEWTSIIAHDLRQPVTVISGYVGLMERALRRHGCPEEEGRTLEHIRVAARNLDRMIGDLLDVSLVEARRLTLNRQTVTLPDLVQEVVERMKDVMRGHPVRVVVHGEIPPVWADPGRIEQVLDNLLSNAAKYSYPGTQVLLEVDYQDDQVRVSVTNEGPGIPPDQLPHLFTRYYRAGLAARERAPGLGLGLYISKGLIEAHGGRIWAESIPGKTTTFRFTLPVARGE